MVEESKIPVQPESERFVLEQAFKHFSLETERLELTYQSLEKQFQSIQQSLQDTNTKLYGKLAELDFTTSYLEAILSHIAQGLLFIDLNGIVTTYTMTAEEIFEIKADQLILHSIWDFFSDTAFGFSLKEALASKQSPKTVFTTWEKKDQKLDLEIETTFVGMNARLCLSASQRHSPITVQGLLILVRNITEFRRLQSIASRYDRLKELGEMAARVAHEIRNPLGGIKGFASLLQEDLKDQPQLQQMATQIVEGTETLNRFVSNILNYTRPFHPQFESIDLIPFIQDILQLVQADNSLSPGTKCKLQSSETSLIIPIDPQLFRSAILNLCVNALQAMPQGGVLDVIVRKDDQQVEIKIQDTGVGIPEEYLDKIFSPFFTTKDNGNGLGLSEVYKVIQVHSGSIEVQSKVGQGSLFSIKIPLKISG